jgi:8-oxo-dGTP pyrophosphatase MutT (NUDIX family)
MNKRDEFLIIDEFEQLLRAATKEVIIELGLDEIVIVGDIEPKDNDQECYVVGLRHLVGPKQYARRWFYVTYLDVLTSAKGGRITNEELKPFVRAELVKLFTPAMH